MDNQNQNIFSLTVSCTGTQFAIDSNQLNMLHSATDDDSEARDLLIQIENTLRETYDRVTPLMRRLLNETVGEVEESKIHCLSESTIFFTQEEAEDD